jgi:hypothetical protein
MIDPEIYTSSIPETSYSPKKKSAPASTITKNGTAVRLPPRAAEGEVGDVAFPAGDVAFPAGEVVFPGVFV